MFLVNDMYVSSIIEATLVYQFFSFKIAKINSKAIHFFHFPYDDNKKKL